MEAKKYYSISIKDWKRNKDGILIAEGKEWILLHGIFDDYIIDGLTIIRKDNINEVIRDQNVEFYEKVLKASGKWNFRNTPQIPLDSVDELFLWLQKNQIVFQFSLKDESAIYIGKIEKMTPKTFWLRSLGTRGKWDKELLLFRIQFVRIIELETDYMNSLLSYNEKYEK